MRRPHRLILLLGLTLACVMLATACERIAPIRTLPSWVRGIYIPMVRNRSFEPGIEEQATILTQEAFLADGRLDVVRKEDADATLLIEIVQWDERAGGTSGDRITDRRAVNVQASLRLVEPYNENAVIADLGTIRLPPMSFLIDTRSVRFEPEPDRKEAVLRALADQIVLRTITGFPTDVGPFDAPAAAPVTTPEDMRIEDVFAPRPGTIR